jgi:hypothetical protein
VVPLEPTSGFASQVARIFFHFRELQAIDFLPASRSLRPPPRIRWHSYR